jgi:hypothetical protein
VGAKSRCLLGQGQILFFFSLLLCLLLWHSQKFLQCLKYIIIEFIPSTTLLYAQLYYFYYLKFVKFCFCPRIWSITITAYGWVLCEFENDVYFADVKVLFFCFLKKQIVIPEFLHNLTFDQRILCSEAVMYVVGYFICSLKHTDNFQEVLWSCRSAPGIQQCLRITSAMNWWHLMAYYTSVVQFFCEAPTCKVLMNTEGRVRHPKQRPGLCRIWEEHEVVGWLSQG